MNNQNQSKAVNEIVAFFGTRYRYQSRHVDSPLVAIHSR